MSNTTARRSGRGGQRRSRTRRPGAQGSRGGTSTRSKKQPQSLWQKIVAFFTADAGRAPTKGKAAAPRQTAGGGKPAAKSRPKPDGGGRQPEILEVTSPRLYVGNLSYDATESDLFDLFNGVGKVQNAEVVTHKQTQRSKGFAFVEMQSLDEARRAVDTLHDQEFLGRKLVVSGAKSDPAKAA